MLCAFEGPPRILRLHGRGEVVPASDGALRGAARAGRLRAVRGARVAPLDRRRGTSTRVADSCGYGVPLMDYVGERPHQDASSAKRVRVHGPDAYVDYQREHNAASIDGLPAVEL